MDDFRIEPIHRNSQIFEQVIALGDKNRKTLGMLPKKAFEEYADQKTILTATSQQGELAGYLLYGKSSSSVIRLTHLCVCESFRGKGIGKKLIDKLLQISKQLDALTIKLSCRRDYNLGAMWSSFGFIAIGEKQGRGKSGDILTIWALDLDYPPLIKAILENSQEPRTKTVVDMNVFYDFYDSESGRDIEESAALMSDWLSDVEFYLTSEAKNEIAKIENDAHRKEVISFSGKFPVLECLHEDFQAAETIVSNIFGESISPNLKSDVRHIARAIGANANFFITRDKELLKKQEEVYESSGLLVLRPASFVMRIDELRNEYLYQPKRLHGTLSQESRVRDGEHEDICVAFLKQKEGEKKSTFLRYLLDLTSAPHRYTTKIYKTHGTPVALLAYEKTASNILDFPIFRVVENYKLTETLTKHLALAIVQESVKQECIATRVSEKYLSQAAISTFKNDGFIKQKDFWIRPSLSGVKSIEETFADLNKFAVFQESSLDIKGYFSEEKYDELKQPNIIAAFEKKLHPLKIIDSGIPCFVVPIRAWWASQLFDYELAGQILWGSSEELSLLREMIYYRAARNSGGLVAPARILWYVSDSPEFQNTKAIRACSRLDEVNVDKPKNLYKKYRRLGIYKFENLKELVKDDLNVEIMALKFSNTEIFPEVIDYQESLQILGRRSNFQSPLRIREDAFTRVYYRGTNSSPFSR